MQLTAAPGREGSPGLGRPQLSHWISPLHVTKWLDYQEEQEQDASRQTRVSTGMAGWKSVFHPITVS